MLWKVRCTRCGFGEDCEEWKAARELALFHANETEHWGRVVLSRPVDAAAYWLSPWGMERRRKSRRELDRKVA